MQSVVDPFFQYLRGLAGRELLDGYEGYDMRFAVNFTDLVACWVVTVEKGAILDVSKSATDEASARVWFDLSEPVFWDIVEGRISPQAAFFRRQTDIRGNLFEGMKLAKLLSLFFERYPYTR